MPEKISQQSHNEALATAKSIKKPGQSKEQTKLIAAGIEKGIAAYKKQHKAKMRSQDKQRKKAQRNHEQHSIQAQQSIDNKNNDTQDTHSSQNSSLNIKLPWTLLILSWLGFIAYLTLFIS